MSDVVNRRSQVFHTELGQVNVVTEVVNNFDVDDVIRLRASAQAKKIQLINMGKAVNVNSPKGARTIDSIYTNNEEELPE